MQASETSQTPKRGRPKTRIIQVTIWVPEIEHLRFACQQLEKAGLTWAIGKHAGKFAVFRRRVPDDPEEIPAGDVQLVAWVTHWRDTPGGQARTQRRGSVAGRSGD